MTASADPVLPRVPDDSVVRFKLTPPRLVWPRNVPSTQAAVTLMFDAQRLPAALHASTRDFLQTLSLRNLASPPGDVEVEQWLRAVGVTWRLTAAAVLAKQARTHDETALQQLFDEADGVRQWLLTLANQPGFAGQLEAQGLRGMLQAAWGAVLDNAPPPPATAPPRPQARTGKTGLNRMPVAPTPAPRRAVTQPALKAVGQPVQLRRWVLAGAFIFAIAARLVLVQPDLKVPYQAAEPSEPAASPKSEGSP